MDQRPHLHGERGSGLPLLPIQRLPKSSDGAGHTRRVVPRREECTVAWICALNIELEASRAMLDDQYVLPPIAGDDNLYVLGHIGKHKVVMTGLAGQYGNTRAAIVATDLKRSFPGIRAIFIVGIGGGAPSMGDVHLGDVVVGTSVMQYDFGKLNADEQFQVTAVAKHTTGRLASAISIFRTRHDAHGCGEQMLNLMQSRLPNLSRPSHPDYLFQASYDHHPSAALTCADCDLNRLLPRAPRSPDIPAVFYGGIASGNSVMKNARRRDEISARHKLLCFEMEAAGAMGTSQCLAIRGICDYADSHKNEAWQQYAAAIAAAYTRLFLQYMPHELESKTTFELRRTAKSHIKSARQLWLRSPRLRWLIISSSVLLVSLIVVVPTILVSLAKKAAAQKHQNAILPHILGSADLNGQTLLLARGHDGRLWFTTKERGSWTGRWSSTDQQAKSQPSCLVWGNPKRLGVFYIRDDSTVTVGSFLNGTWGDWETLGIKASSTAVLCLEAQSAAVHVWVREDTQVKLIQHNYWEKNLNDWHTVTPSWESAINEVEAKGAHSAPAVACRNSTTTNDVIIYDKDLGSPYHKQWHASRNRWGPWNALGGFYVGDPVLVSPADDRLDFFGVSKSSNSLVHTSWTFGSGYSDSRDLNGSWKSVPSIALTASDRLDVFILGKSGTIHHRALLGSTWSSTWSDLNISAASAPLATRLDGTPPQIMLQAVAAGGVVLNSEWEATSDGGLKNTVPITQIGDGLSNDWLEVD
ncbi:hypothetical protein LLEC1_07604 [Akanthomyces lecanii]|uniref:Uncharacterized protein n=1 Tax=Cordyceps confragosa TaxID=2714763 RepID=A0A179ID58_CORDF|nr:hypothetical protein LLEC1_07604 [Akanthomyces lecanii]